MRYLIVTADDFGYNARRDEGIVESFNTGVVTRTSLLVNGASASTAITLAKQHNIPLGLHLNLTEGVPINNKCNVSTLVDSNGLMLGKLGLRECLSCKKISLRDVKNEVDAQIKRFIELVGKVPNHLDGHQHVHALSGISMVVAQCMYDHSIEQTRIPIEDTHREWFKLNTEFYESVNQNAKDAIQVYTSRGIRFPDRFMGISLMGEYMQVPRIISTISDLFNGGATSIEFMAHPGYPCMVGVGGCGNGPDEFACSPDRQHEITILQDIKLRKFLVDHSITLIS